jgi:hypothetical protein
MRQRLIAVQDASATIGRLAPTCLEIPVPKLIWLGANGGPRVTAARANAANVVVLNDRPYLIDCGYGVTRQLIAAGISPQRERAILITHHHADHWTTTGREGVLRKTGADHRPLAQQQFPTWLAHILKRRILRGKSLSLCCCQNEHVQNFSFLIN